MGDQTRDARLVRLDDLRRCLATAFERLQLTPEDAEGLSQLLMNLSFAAIPTTGSQPSACWLASIATAR